MFAFQPTLLIQFIKRSTEFVMRLFVVELLNDFLIFSSARNRNTVYAFCFYYIYALAAMKSVAMDNNNY